MSPIRVVGIVLVRNEDRHLERVLRNVAGFCDAIHVADHGSTDETPAILRRLAVEIPHLDARQVRTPRESNDLLQSYVSTPTWIFGVDGDEIYDPAGLQRLRRQMDAGAFDPWWVVFGNVLNCDALDLDRHTASGYLAPPCRSMTKLYNFRMLQTLDATAPQRLHSHKGGDIFHAGFHAMLRHELYKKVAWEEADFRCLHTCFLPRSSGEAAGDPRENVTESLQPLRRLKRLLRRAVGLKTPSDYKREKYQRGPRVTVDATPFFP